MISLQAALKACMCDDSSNSAARGKFALLNASCLAVPPLCEHEVVYEIGKIVVLNANDSIFSTSVFARGDLESLA